MCVCVCVCVFMRVHARWLDDVCVCANVPCAHVCVYPTFAIPCPGSKTIGNQHVSQGQEERINTEHSEFPSLSRLPLDCIFIKSLIEPDVETFNYDPRWEPFAFVVFSEAPGLLSALCC